MTRAILLTLVLIGCLAGCSYVQWLPSSACEKVVYNRDGSHVVVYAECDL